MMGESWKMNRIIFQLEPWTAANLTAAETEARMQYETVLFSTEISFYIFEYVKYSDV